MRDRKIHNLQAEAAAEQNFLVANKLLLWLKIDTTTKSAV